MSDLGDAGQLEVIFGPMFSGKTSELIRRIQRYHLANYRCLIIKYSDEKKFFSNTTVISHDDHSLPAVFLSNLEDVKEEVIKEFDVIGIDEGHLFSGLISFCESESDRGKRIIVAALDTCGENIFKEVLGLIPLAESVTKLTAICMSCNNDATFTKAVPNDEDMIDKQQKFVSVCGDCYLSSNHSWRSPFKKYFSSETSPA